MITRFDFGSLPLVLLLAVLDGAAPASAQEVDQVADAVAFAGALVSRRPNGIWAANPAPSDATRTEVVLTLPREGHVLPSRAEQTKLKPARALLRAAHRSDMVIVVIDVPQAFVGLHGRVVLLVSRPTLAILSAPELRAITAHELGHDVLWDQYEAARRDNSAPRLQALELRCDALAVLILESEALAVQPLVSGLEKLERFNHRIFARADSERYPRLELRERVISAVALQATSARVGHARSLTSYMDRSRVGVAGPRRD